MIWWPWSALRGVADSVSWGEGPSTGGGTTKPALGGVSAGAWTIPG